MSGIRPFATFPIGHDLLELSVTAAVVDVGGISSVEAFGDLAFVAAGDGEVFPASIGSAEAFGTAVINSRDGAAGVAFTRLIGPRVGLRANGELIVLF